jgi:hypothetical protein
VTPSNPPLGAAPTPGTSVEPAGPAGLTHGCARCGAPVPVDVGLCDRCNPLGLRDVSASQVHGTVVFGFLVAVVLLALGARMAVSGVGPFPASVAAVEAAANGLAVSVTVTNEGSATAQTTCRVSDAEDRGGGTSAFVLSPRLEPGQTTTFTRTVTELGTDVIDLVVECRTP